MFVLKWRRCGELHSPFWVLILTASALSFSSYFRNTWAAHSIAHFSRPDTHLVLLSSHWFVAPLHPFFCDNSSILIAHSGLFIVIPFLLPSLVSSTGFLLFFTLLSISEKSIKKPFLLMSFLWLKRQNSIAVLYTLYPFAYYFLLLAGFKYYRQALRSIMTCRWCRPSTIRDVTSTKPSQWSLNTR